MTTRREPALTVPLRDGMEVVLRPDQVRGILCVVDEHEDELWISFWAGGKHRTVATALSWGEGMRKLWGSEP